MEKRIEHDTMGEIEVPKDRMWGAQTARSLQNFCIGGEKMPPEIIEALVFIKKSAAATNCELGQLDQYQADAITKACDEILDGKHIGEFPLSVWQTGSGTQTNMNVNEVVAFRASQIMGISGAVHPNDTVNMGQSSNDTFPSAMHIAALLSIKDMLMPAIDRLAGTLGALAERYSGIVKIGRTHLQDATPLTLGQEISGWQEMLLHSRGMIAATLANLRELAIGGTAVGTGLNTHRRFGELCAARISQYTGARFVSAQNKFHALASRDAMVFAHGALKALASDLMKIANDVRWLASGPRAGIGEITIPANEPGSSIMPGKVNPTQCEAVMMVAVRVMGNDTVVGVAASQGNFELNVFMPVMADAFLQSVRLLADAMLSFDKNCVSGIEPNQAVIRKNLYNSLMLATALNPHIGYEKAAKVAKLAYQDGISLRKAAVKLGYMTADKYDRLVQPENMIGPMEDRDQAET